MKGCFITATGTGSGKTIVTAALLRALRRKNAAIIAVKPVQTGCGRRREGGWIRPDLDCYRRANRSAFLNFREEEVSPFCFSEPCSPHLAASLDHRPAVRVETIVERLRSLKPKAEGLLVEGAGGIKVPLNHQETMLDLALALELPVLVVVDNRLGAINQALLTMECLRRAEAPILGMVLNHPSPTPVEEKKLRQDNAHIIGHFSRTEWLAEIPHLEGFSEENDAAWSDLTRLLDPLADQLLELPSPAPNQGT
jgi:adenosylmethionine-8-amino-7-oxononanoate aminotransferase